ncbi:MAG: hypothetical protein K2P54_05390, partial [Odoribacter sp.]|nr:hypothetical protein [Odoribacter sp.]
KFRRKVTCAVGEAETLASVYVAPLPWTVNLDIYTNVYPSFTVTSTWANMPQAHWKLDHAPAGIAIANKGVMSGLTANSVFWADVTVSSDKCPGIEYDKKIVVRRDFSAVGVGSIQLDPGEYVMECWGAQGGRSRANWALAAYGGNGAYTRGEITLINAMMFYTYTGGKGYDSGSNGRCGGAAGGWNGGAAGGKDGNCDSQPEPGGGGGGASDIRMEGGSWNVATSLRSRIMVAAGGGGASWRNTGGAGGALSASGGASQTAGYTFGAGGAGGNNSRFTSGPGGGGSGYYGGKGGQGDGVVGYGGSSFISGYAGCNAINASGSHTGQAVHYSGLQFYNTSMQAGARSGNGLVRISPVVP